MKLTITLEQALESLDNTKLYEGKDEPIIRRMTPMQRRNYLKMRDQRLVDAVLRSSATPRVDNTPASKLNSTA